MEVMVCPRHHAGSLPGGAGGAGGAPAGDPAGDPADRHNSVVRVVSLVPSVTETLLSWGVRPVAVTRFCEHPEIRRVGGTKDPDVATIVSMRPDLVVMDQEENRVEDHHALVRAGVTVHVTAVRDLEDVAPTLASLAARVGTTAPVMPLRPPVPVMLRAFVPIWRRPWMALGAPTYGTSVLRQLGMANVFDNAEVPYPVVELDDAAERHPDVVVAPDEPYPFGTRHGAELRQVAPVWFVDGKDLVWWGTRTASALARLAAGLASWAAT